MLRGVIISDRQALAETIEVLYYCGDVTWAAWYLKSPATLLFVQPFVQRKHQNPRYWSVVMGIHRSVASHNKGPAMRKMFPCHDALFRGDMHPEAEKSVVSKMKSNVDNPYLIERFILRCWINM